MKLLAECERMFSFSTPKYTESAPPCIAAARHSKFPAGAIIGYDGARLHELREPTLRLIQERTGQTFSHIQDETNPHEYYLDSLGVLPEYRNLGIGSKLLIALRDKAFSEGHKRAGLLVNTENLKAEHLYLSLGFERIECRNFFGHPMWHLQATNPQERR